MANRLTWGARPSDLSRVASMGVSEYVEWQLDHEAIPDPLVDAFMAAHPVLSEGAAGISRALDDNYSDVVGQVLWARVYRAVHSERQLFEKVVEFWTDHFNVPLPDLVAEKTVDDREVIRKHALGSFRDLLLASARSPAMLLYLDNASSHRDHPNENYSREIMELHTLGVDGGYTQDDVREVARCFTGWTLRQGWRGEMVFDRGSHDEGEKLVLGRRIAAGRGIEDGLEVLDILASHPSTARFVSTKLCRRFVADDPPARLVEAVASTFLATGGDVRAMLRTIFSSEEFLAARGTKLRRPLESVVATLRALSPGVVVNDPWSLGWTLEQMGHLPYNWFPPNGYPDDAEPWLNVSALLHRWNFATILALRSIGWYGDEITVDLSGVVKLPRTVGQLVDTTWRRLVASELQADDRDALLAGVGVTDEGELVTEEFVEERWPALVALVLSSPVFQLT